MYGYIFWVIYEKNKLRDKSDWLSRTNASGIVFFALLLHILLVLQIVNVFYYGRKTLPASWNVNKGILFVLALVSLALVCLYFNKERIKKLQRKYESKDSILNENGGFVVALLVFVPLIAIIVMG
jgi:hypothetical protein